MLYAIPRFHASSAKDPLAEITLKATFAWRDFALRRTPASMNMGSVCFTTSSPSTSRRLAVGVGSVEVTHSLAFCLSQLRTRLRSPNWQRRSKRPSKQCDHNMQVDCVDPRFSGCINRSHVFNGSLHAFLGLKLELPCATLGVTLVT